jgi:hypothetical protein
MAEKKKMEEMMQAENDYNKEYEIIKVVLRIATSCFYLSCTAS